MYLLPYHSGGQKFKFSFMGWSQGVSREDHSGNSLESLCSCCLQFLEHVCMLWPMATQRWLSNISISPQVPNLYICFHIDWCSCSISAKTVDQWEVSPSCNDVSRWFWQQEVDSFERPLFCKLQALIRDGNQSSQLSSAGLLVQGSHWLWWMSLFQCCQCPVSFSYDKLKTC